MTGNALAIRHVPFEDLGLLAPLLNARGYRTSHLDAGIDRITPEALLRADLVVVLGGPIGVYETAAYPFLEAEKEAIAARLRAGGPTLGVCLGAQLIADVLGAEVRSTGRKEIGYGPLTLTPAGRDSALAPLDGVPVLHWHGDQFAIPPGATRLAETPGFPNQAFSLGDEVLGLQFHLEADHTRLEPWLIGHAHELAAAGIDPNRVRADAAAYGPGLAGVAIDVVDDWLGRAETA
ncbi:glutamine amidotransferase [Nonomuraea pusilla]|uniref:GMP synthase (Glutamine-hydrolysing) n=1 Tax=Nonomuraea pusilla TaxID=46177 RepID=A0A1H7WRE6_9ACTN|nr:glutamine amidotransferase [Nonomuraea pusilla]SEM23964.1 GMP synthase (glutamine-hydrolysing) [Nonomuraea pusilla]